MAATKAKAERNGIRQERDLYAPVKAWFEGQGWRMKGEVAHCDGLAVREGLVLAVEMKLTLNLDLILQGMERQRMADLVYLAVPRKPRALSSRRWYALQRMLRQLNLGLLVVTLQPGREPVEEQLTPAEEGQAKPTGRGAARRKLALREFEGRSGDYNTGGSTGEKLMTAYREAALKLAAELERRGPSTAHEIAGKGQSSKGLNRILYLNHYNWFVRLGQGRYDLTPSGREALTLYNLPCAMEEGEAFEAFFGGTVED